MRASLKTQVLSEHILRRGLSNNAFAMKAGISSPYMAQLLAKKRQPSGRVREKIIKASGLDFDTLFTIERDTQVGVLEAA